MKKFRSLVFALTAFALALLPASGYATINFYDNFDPADYGGLDSLINAYGGGGDPYTWKDSSYKYVKLDGDGAFRPETIGRLWGTIDDDIWIQRSFPVPINGNVTISFDLMASVTGNGWFDVCFADVPYSNTPTIHFQASGSDYYLYARQGATNTNLLGDGNKASLGNIYSITLDSFVFGANPQYRASVVVNGGGSPIVNTISWSSPTYPMDTLDFLDLWSDRVPGARSEIDQINITGDAVPEPGAVMLFGIGLCGLLFGWFRRYGHRK